ncbi:Rha family transcriptional regulator [Pseudomonas mendocina]|nr:Rha family transcriptional regulator [Pseudomonas mendocina]
MNALTTLNTTNATLTMSSREIAELLGCRHDNVKVTIERLVAKGVIVRPALQDEPTKDAMGRTRMMSVYRIGKRDSYVIVAQLSPEFTAKLVDRWQELEAQVAAAPKVPQTFAEALRLAAELEEQRAYLEQENKQLTVENKVMSEELNILTVDEYRALRHLYLTKPQKAKLSNYAKSYCLSKGIEVTKQERLLPHLGIKTSINIYPREALDHAALVLGLV